jgi:hypothetical protein
MTEKDYLDPKGCWGDPAGIVRRMSGDSIGPFWSCLFSNFWVAAEGRSSEPFKRVRLVLPPAFRAFPIDDRLKHKPGLCERYSP